MLLNARTVENKRYHHIYNVDHWTLHVYVVPPGFEDDPTAAQNIRCLWRGCGAALI